MHRLLQRFLNRLLEKVRACIEQYNVTGASGKDSSHFLNILRENQRVILKNAKNSNFQELITKLYGISLENENKTFVDLENNHNEQESFPKRNLQLDSKQTNSKSSNTVLTIFSNNSNKIQQYINFFDILLIDEKELRRRYFSFQENQSRNKNQLKGKELQNGDNKAKEQTGAKRTRTVSSGNLKNGQKQEIFLITVSDTHPLFLEMMERNKININFIKRYEIVYQKHKFREMIKQKKQESKEKNQQEYFSLNAKEQKTKYNLENQHFTKRQKISSDLHGKFHRKNNSELNNYNELNLIYQRKQKKQVISKSSLPELKPSPKENHSFLENLLPGQKNQRKFTLSNNALNQKVTSSETETSKLPVIPSPVDSPRIEKNGEKEEKNKQLEQNFINNQNNVKCNVQFPIEQYQVIEKQNQNYVKNFNSQNGEVVTQPSLCPPNLKISFQRQKNRKSGYENRKQESENDRKQLKNEIKLLKQLKELKQKKQLKQKKSKIERNDLGFFFPKKMQKNTDGLELYNASSVFYMSKVSVKESIRNQVSKNQQNRNKKGVNFYAVQQKKRQSNCYDSQKKGISLHDYQRKVLNFGESQDRKSKIQAFYTKIRPSKLGALRARSSQEQQHSFLMACRSYQPFEQNQ